MFRIDPNSVTIYHAPILVVGATMRPSTLKLHPQTLTQQMIAGLALLGARLVSV